MHNEITMSFSFGNVGGSALGSTEKRTGTLFGSTTAPAGGLFGQSQQQQPQLNTTQSGLFGSAAAAPQSNSLFGASQQQNTGGASLFGQPQQAQQQTIAESGWKPLWPAPASTAGATAAAESE